MSTPRTTFPMPEEVVCVNGRLVADNRECPECAERNEEAMTDKLIDKAKSIAEILGQPDFWTSPDMSRFTSETVRALIARLEAAEKVAELAADDVYDADGYPFEPMVNAIAAWRAIRDAKEQP